MAKPRKLEVTDEMRKAVFAELCETQGHALSMAEALRTGDDNRFTVTSSDPNKLPHITCTRCGIAWVVVNEAGTSYEDAEEKLRGRLKDTKDIDDMRKKRKPTA